MKHNDIRVFLVAAALATACGGPIRSTPAAAAPEELAPPVPTPLPAPAGAGSLESRLRKSATLSPILDEAARYRFQVLVSVPSPDGSGWLEREGFRVDAEYFYPASAIKLCSAVAGLVALTELRDAKGPQVDVTATLAVDSPSRRRGGISIANLVQGALVMSDNDASNDLFDLAGHDGLHEQMWRMGLSSVRMRHRLGTLSPTDDVRVTPRLDLAMSGETVVVAAREGTVALGRNDLAGVQVGDSYFSRGKLVNEPMSFEDKNRVSLSDLQELLIGIMRPDLRTSGGPRLGPQERALLVDALTTLPSSRGAKPAVDREHKPFLAGIERVVPRGSLTLASKSGRAYGFLVENAYVLDARTGRSFFLTAAMYANANGRLNDDLYQYSELAFPVFAELGEIVARTVLGTSSL